MAHEKPCGKCRGSGVEASDLPSHMVCHACGFSGDPVEAGGIYHCPNPFCTISGAWSVRAKVGFQEPPTCGSEGTEMSELGVFLVNWMIKSAEMWGAKVPKNYDRFRDPSVLLKVPGDKKP